MVTSLITFEVNYNFSSRTIILISKPPSTMIRYNSPSQFTSTVTIQSATLILCCNVIWCEMHGKRCFCIRSSSYYLRSFYECILNILVEIRTFLFQSRKQIKSILFQFRTFSLTLSMSNHLIHILFADMRY